MSKFATLSDKYNCVEAMSLAAKVWFKPLESHDIHGFCQLMVAAYTFHDKEAFRQITQCLILRHVGSYRNLRHADAIIERIGWDILRKPYQFAISSVTSLIACSPPRRRSQSRSNATSKMLDRRS